MTAVTLSFQFLFSGAVIEVGTNAYRKGDLIEPGIYSPVLLHVTRVEPAISLRCLDLCVPGAD